MVVCPFHGHLVQFLALVLSVLNLNADFDGESLGRQLPLRVHLTHLPGVRFPLVRAVLGIKFPSVGSPHLPKMHAKVAFNTHL